MGLDEAPTADVTKVFSARKEAAIPDEDYDEYTGYRLLYHFDKFAAGWRKLVVFYLTMFIAGYAQVVNNYVFWGAWAALLLVYWEPYLSPPLPWTTNYEGDEDNFHDTQQPVPKWGRNIWGLPQPTPDEQHAIQMWLFATRRSLPHRQKAAHRLLQVMVALPCACLGVGVVRQQHLHQVKDMKATYSSYLLFAVVLLYTTATCISLIFHLQLYSKLRGKASHPGSASSDAPPVDNNPAWQPQHMLFFVCKILGETLNTTVQTLVAGAFVQYMTDDIFVLCILITGFSYTATNLLFEMGPGDPVSEDGEGYTACWCLPCVQREHPHSDREMPAAGVASGDKPPFLVYKWPKGLRGWSIIALLIAVAGPSIAILVKVGIAVSTNTPSAFFIADGACTVQSVCFTRYQVMLFIMGGLGVLSAYYAFTVGFVGSGPVTWLYRSLHSRYRKRGV